MRRDESSVDQCGPAADSLRSLGSPPNAYTVAVPGNLMWPLTIIVFLVLGTLAFRGARWAYATFVFLGLLFFPARVGFRMDPQPCEWELSVPLALFSLTKYAHIVLFAIFFLLTTVQVRRYSRRAQLLIAAGAVLAMGVYVEMAQALTGKGHCRLRDLIPDAAGALLGALLVVSWHTIRRPGLDPMP